MLSPTERFLFILLVAISLGATVVTFREMIQIIARGQGRLKTDDLPRRILTGAAALITQGSILKNRKITSLFHYGVAWGFIFYGLVNVVDVIEGFVAGFHIPGVLGDGYRLLADLFSVAVLVGVAYLMVRRFAFPAGARTLSARDNVKMMDKARAGIPKDSLVVGLFILLHVGFRFLSQTFDIALEGSDPLQPFANALAPTWTALGLGEQALTFGFHASWWIALGLIFLFLPYFPYTKHAHLFMGPINFMTRPDRPALGAMETIDFEDETIEQFGVARLTDLHQTHVLDAFACIMCNRCQDACPAYHTGKELSPAALEINKRYYLRQNMSDLAAGGEDAPHLMDYAISESALWACTACGACVEVCPVGNEPMFDILHIRRDQVLMQADFPNELQGAFRGMERTGNPWSTTEDRLDWTEPLPFDVPTVEENPDFDVLYWVGCAGAFDPKGQEIARSIATVLHAAGVNFAVMGEMETCTGDSARRAGNEYLYYEMAMANIETLNEIGAGDRRIVTGCPHCLHTIGKEYEELGGDFRVLHHTQMIADLVGRGKLRLNGQKLEQVTFHDPCFLGRHNGVYDAPRDALAQAGATLLEMERNRSQSFCCGAGGAQFWKEEEHGEQAVNHNRYQEAQSTGAGTLAIGCPFCARMLDDASKEAEQTMQVKDVAEVVAGAIS
ncbi:MAG: heterodisulfide reductase-related iron-sulfur binding cluster [Candidatus Promineifilaceae bacterium]|nr:heterodisulfide reductase-related iron-sulfur binding cluster [Candidatus Promineifilaceae bacterium]